jgi:hypothetical protein
MLSARFFNWSLLISAIGFTFAYPTPYRGGYDAPSLYDCACVVKGGRLSQRWGWGAGKKRLVRIPALTSHGACFQTNPLWKFSALCYLVLSVSPSIWSCGNEKTVYSVLERRCVLISIWIGSSGSVYTRLPSFIVCK